MSHTTAVNTIIVNSVEVVVKGKNRPFSNDFVVLEYKTPSNIVLANNEVSVYVKCTETSQEPGRIYFCIYNNKGKLDSCVTIN